jgi:hypothetical protein
VGLCVVPHQRARGEGADVPWLRPPDGEDDMMPCLFCNGDRSAPDHDQHCDGRQGAIEAALEPVLRARGSDPETSHASMAAYDPERMANAIDCVIRLYHDRGPMADYELAEAFATAWPSVCSVHLYRQARSAARDKGWIYDTGERRVNPTSHRRQVVWAFHVGSAPVIERCATCGHVLRRRTTPRDAI